METGVATYYDRLLRWNRLADAIGYGGGSRSLTVHRALADPRAGGRATYTRLHDILVEQLAGVPAPRVLDAGCGMGGTMLALAAALDASCVGVTLSAGQAAAANAAAAGRGLGTRVVARVGTYDDPPAGPFDVVIAIESLAHSPQPGLSVARLGRMLAPGGLFVVVDDMPEAGVPDRGDLAAFKRGWSCPVLFTRPQYLEAFAAAGLRLDRQSDLTADCRPRPSWRIAFLSGLNRVATPVCSRGVRQVLASHRGGLALERLLRRGEVRYRLLVAQKPGLQVS